MAAILAIEDELLVRLVIVEALADAGHTVLEANDGEEALGLLRSGKTVDLILTDVRMPRMDGFALVRAARALHPEVPVVFMTGYAGSAIRPEFPHAVVLDKPFSPEELLKTVNRVLAI